MLIHVMRMITGPEATIGNIYLDGKPYGFTLEDERRWKKVRNETRIPDGLYKVDLRSVSSPTNAAYEARYGTYFHRGMIWLRHVPGFTYIYIHTGNTDDHTAGCILVGETAEFEFNGNFRILESRNCYRQLYPKVANTIMRGEDVWCQVSSYA